MYRYLVFAFIALFATSCAVGREDNAQDASAALESDSSTTSASSQSDEADDADSDVADATPSTAFSPATTAPAADVAATVTYEDHSFEVLHEAVNQALDSMNEEIELTQALFGGPTPAGFTADALYHHILNQVLEDELGRAGVDPTEVDVSPGRDQILPDLANLMAIHPDPAAEAERLYDSVDYLNLIGHNISYQMALADVLAEDAPEADRVPCVSHIIVETELEAADVKAIVESGIDFAQAAKEYSTGPSGPSGGVLGCRSTDAWVPEFAAAVDDAEVGEIVGPLQTEFGWHILVVDEYSADGTQLATTALSARLESSSIEIDPRVGVWDASEQRVFLS